MRWAHVWGVRSSVRAGSIDRGRRAYCEIKIVILNLISSERKFPCGYGQIASAVRIASAVNDKSKPGPRTLHIFRFLKQGKDPGSLGFPGKVLYADT